MHASGYPKIFSTLAVSFLLTLPVLTNFLAQNSQPSPTPSPLTSPTASATPSPPRTPSPTPLPGAQNFHQWGSITVFNGLPSDSVRAIAQTPDGVMWFGTDNGLARFDGRRVQNFSFGSADTNRVTALKTDATGQLWVGTAKGAFIYSENGFQSVDGTQGVGITVVLLGDEVFLGTDAGIVLRVAANESGTLTAEKLFPDPVLADDGNPLSITSLVENEGKLLAGTSGRGVFVIKPGSVSEYPAAPRPIFVNSLVNSETGKLWLGTDAAKSLSGIYMVEGGSRAQRVAAPTADVLALEVNESGLWAGTERYGLFHIAESKLTKNYTFENTSGGLRSNTIFTLFTDREGVIWIGTNRGVSRFDRLGAYQQTVSDIPNGNFIRTLFQSGDGQALFAGSNRGLFSRDGEKWSRETRFGEKVVYAIGATMDGMVIGTPTGIFNSKGRLIAGGDTRGLEMFHSATYAAILGKGVVDISSTRQNVIFPDETACSLLTGNDELWIGTVGHGLFSFDGKSVKNELLPDILKSGAIWKISLGTDGNIWIASEHGVFRVQNGQAEQIIAAEDVRDVFVDGPDVWAATTTRGLLHARRDDRFGWLVSSVGFEQGLPSEKAFSILPINDGLLIATNRGVVTYKPGTIAPKLIPTRILSQRMHDLNELRSTIALEYPQNSVLIEVAGQSSRTFPEEFQYAFVLTNEKGETIDSRISNEPQYTPANLSPGDYTVESRAFDRDLLSSEPLVIRFSIGKAPFPWTATALGVLLVLSLVALVWAVVAHNRSRQRNRELAAARMDLANEAERERRRIARDLHDQTLADLRNLMMKSDKLPSDNSEFRTEIEAVSTEIRRICEDLSPSVLENVGLIAALEFLLSHTIENYKFHADDHLEERIKFPLNAQLQIYRIAQEVLTNIKRHSDAQLVEMKVESSDEKPFVLTISDDGKGFEPRDADHKGRGVTNIKTRASLINARVGWKERHDGGNVFTLKIAG
jgi:signal transduction histidine kinase/ligand-binding sensor domain-containing protein